MKKVLKHWKLYKDAYILQESFAMTVKSYPPPCRNFQQPFYLSVTLYACAQRGYVELDLNIYCTMLFIRHDHAIVASGMYYIGFIKTENIVVNEIGLG